MAKFPVQYTRALPPGRAPAVRAGVLPSTGEEQIGEAVSGLGQALLEIDKARGVAEYSTIKREIDEAGGAAYRARLTTADNAERIKIAEKFYQDADAKTQQSKRGWVNRELKVHLNEIMPEWEDVFAKQDLAIETRQLDDAFKINIQKFMELGDVNSAAKEIMQMKNLNRISQAEAEQQINELPANSGLAVARIDIGNRRYQDAINKLEGLKDLNAKQLDYRDALLADAKRLQREELTALQEQTSRTFLADFWDKKLTDPNLITNALRNGWISAADAKYLRNAMLNPEPAKTELNSYIKVKEALQDLVLGTKTKQDVLSLITSMTDSLSAEDGKSFIKDVYTEPDKEDTFWQKEAYQTIERRLLTTDPISGRLFGSTQQYNRCDLAKIRFDDAIKSAAKAGKPLKGTDYLKKAVEISNQLMPREKQITFGGQMKLPPDEFAEEFAIKEEAKIPERPPAGEGGFEHVVWTFETAIDETTGKVKADVRIGDIMIYQGEKYIYKGDNNWEY